MPNHHVWYELITSDHDAAEAFYTKVVGWRFTDSGVPGMRYSILHAGERPIGGLMTMEGGPRHAWYGYVGVDDVDAFAGKAKAAGGSVHKEPEDIPGVGRFAYVADPQGAAFVLFKGNGTPDPEPLPFMAPGSCGWHELHSSDAAAGFDFYAGLFGWSKDEALDMGPMGTYQLFRTDRDGAAGGMMTDAANGPIWVYYFVTDEIEAAKARVLDAGGQVIHGPMEVPGGAWVLNGIDPQGAMFALVAPPKGWSNDAQA
ncbi:MAG: VOC family protein [Sphingomonadaceae bacterium]|nr:VOC family protein [Sphingomonadaceae bacterium]